MPSLTITFSVADGQRVAKAFGYMKRTPPDFQNDPPPATIDEVKGWIIRQVKAQVRQIEGMEAAARVTLGGDVDLTQGGLHANVREATRGTNRLHGNAPVAD